MIPEIGFIDGVTFAAYLVFVILIGILAKRKSGGGTEGYFLASKSLPWFAIGASIVASSISTEQFVGEVGFSYRYGLSVANWEWGIYPAVTLMVFVFVPNYYSGNIRTMPEFLERRFDRRVGVVFALLTVLSYVFINMAGVVYSGGYFIEKVFGVNRYVIMWVIAGSGGLLTIYGGLSSVVWTDLLQTTLLLAGGFLVFFLGIHAVPGGWSDILGSGERAHLMPSLDHPALPWTAMLVLIFSTNVWYYTTNQYINQRCLGARTQWDARIGVVFSGFLGIFLALVVSFPGMIAYALNPDLPEADAAYPFLVTTLIPAGLRGVMMAALTAAIMSTFNSLLNSSATILTLDIYKPFFRPAADDRQTVRAGRWFGVAILCVGTAWAPMVEFFGSIFAFFQEAWVLFAAPIIAVFITGIFWKRASSSAALYTLLLCFPVFVLAYVRRAMDWDINPFNLGGIMLVLSFGFLIVFSLLTGDRKDATVRRPLWTKDFLHLPENESAERPSILRNFVFWWALLGLVFGGLYIRFW